MGTRDPRIDADIAKAAPFAMLEQAPTAFIALSSDWRCIYINPVGPAASPHAAGADRIGHLGAFSRRRRRAVVRRIRAGDASA